MAPKGSDSVASGTEELKPPSTFPGIWKYPTDREKPHRNVDDWLVCKRKDDDIGENLWRVHDKLYNLEKFMKNHPGGPLWIEMTRGTDITEAFETSHVVNVSLVEQTLSKYYVGDAKHPRNSPYTFKEDGFFKTLKRRIEPTMKKVGTQSNVQIRLIQDSEVALFVIFALIGVIYNSTLFQILAGAILTIENISAHNFFHLKPNWRQYYFDLGLQSSYEWKVAHALSHHLFPNTLLDLELTMFPTYQFLPNRPKHWFQRNVAVIYSHVLYAVTFWYDLAKRIYHVSAGHQKLRPENFIVFAQLILFMFIAETPFMGLRSWIFIQTVASYVFLTIGANAAHHYPDSFHDGDEARPDPDFGLCQLDATKNRSDELHKTLIVILATFGEHCLHHLFPTICHSKLIHIKPIFEDLVKEFKEESACTPVSQWEMYKGTLEQLRRTDCRKRTSKKSN